MVILAYSETLTSRLIGEGNRQLFIFPLKINTMTGKDNLLLKICFPTTHPADHWEASFKTGRSFYAAVSNGPESTCLPHRRIMPFPRNPVGRYTPFGRYPVNKVTSLCHPLLSTSRLAIWHCRSKFTL